MKKVILVLAVLLGGCAMGEEPSNSYLQAQKESAIQEWELFFKGVKKGTSEKDLGELLSGKFREKGAHIWGGTGRYSIYYLIDDIIQIRMDFNENGELDTHPIVQEKGIWIRRSDGTLRIPPEKATSTKNAQSKGNSENDQGKPQPPKDPKRP